MPVYKRKDRGDAWYIRISYRPADGSRPIEVNKKSPINTRRQAEIHERKILEQLEAGTYGQRKTEARTFAEVAEEWLALQAPGWRPTTARTYKTRVDVRLVPILGELRVEAITARDISKARAKMALTLAPSTLNATLSVLYRILSAAHEWGLCPAPPTPDRLKEHAPHPKFLSKEEASRLLACAEKAKGSIGAQLARMIRLALNTGLRRGELLALQWSAVDLEARALDVVASLSPAGEALPPKNGRSRRIALNATALAALGEQGEGLVFHHKGGQALSTAGINKALRRAFFAAGLESQGWHVLRHTFASWLVMDGAPIRVVQELLGHSSITMTQRYAHLAPSSMHDAVGLLEK